MVCLSTNQGRKGRIMAAIEEGVEGEQKLFSYLRKNGVEFFQADAIGKEGGNYVVYETKNKAEPFRPPPFLGHGLELRQVRARLKFQREMGIRCKFIVFQKNDNSVCSQWLDVLEEGEKFDTKNGIRIYPIENFEIELI
jgi:hypothetical protein